MLKLAIVVALGAGRDVAPADLIRLGLYEHPGGHPGAVFQRDRAYEWWSAVRATEGDLRWYGREHLYQELSRDAGRRWDLWRAVVAATDPGYGPHFRADALGEVRRLVGPAYYQFGRIPE